VRAGGSPLAGARVRVLGEMPECLPAPATTDGNGFAFQLPPGGPYDLQAVAPDGRVGYARVNSLQANLTQNIDLPATSPLNGGPIYETGVPFVNGWTVQAYYRTGVNAGRLAHAGVEAGPPTGDGLFSLALEVGPAYDLVGQPPAGSAYPFQILYEDYCHAGQPCSNYNLGSVRLRDGFTLGGRVSTSTGQGATGSPIALVRETDVRLGLELSAGTDGNYSALLRSGTWIMTVFPAGEAFAQGALSYLVPRQSIVNADVTKDISLVQGASRIFQGRLLNDQNIGLSGVEVRLLLLEQPVQEGSFSGCDQEWTTTEADGSFSIQCNIIE
jgi:hypothetical protein